MAKAVIFDWDGFLENTMNEVKKTFDYIFIKRGIKVPYEEIERNYDPNWRKFLKKFGIDDISDIEWYEAYKELGLDSNASLYPGAKNFLKKLKGDGYKLAIVTSGGSYRIKERLEKYNLSNLFDAVVTLEDVSKIKPNPQGLEIVLKKLNLEPKDCIFCGDTDADALAAKRAGIRFIGKSGGLHDAKKIKMVNNDEVANDFEELYEMITSS